MVTVTRLPDGGEVVTVTRPSKDDGVAAGVRPRPAGGES